MSTSIQPAVLSVRDFTRWANISRAKTYLLIADGSLRTFKLGSRRLIRLCDAEAWLEALQRTGATEASR